VAATTMALVYVAKGPNQFSRILVAGFALGMGVVVMHYLGMYGMRFGGVFRWDMGLVALSVAIAVVAATAALWLSFRSVSVLVRFAAALVMGVAVCAMHYTGVAAADIICTTTDRAAYPKGFDVIRSFLMPSLVIFFSLSMAAVVIIDQFMIAGSQKK
jgi:NO-binding membrane sensor protein with MHYT domain